MPLKLPNMGTSFELEGYWWTIDQNQKMAGVLKYTESTIELSLFGAFTEGLGTGTLNYEILDLALPIVYGITTDNVPVSLLDCSQISWTPAATQITDLRLGNRIKGLKSILSAKYLILGSHETLESDVFVKCAIEVPHLDKWMGKFPVSIETANMQADLNMFFKTPETISVRSSQHDSDIRLTQGIQYPPYPLPNPLEVKHNCRIVIQPKQPRSVRWLLDRSVEITGLLEVLYGDAISPDKITLHREKLLRPAAMYYARHPYNSRIKSTLDILIDYNELEPVLQAVIDNWFGRSPITRRAAAMLSNVRRKHSNRQDDLLLSYVRIIEVCTQDNEKTNYLPKKQMRAISEKMMEHIPDDAPEGFKNSVSQAISGANRMNLGRKIHHILDRLSDRLVLLFCINKIEFVAGIVSTRNYFAHYSQAKKILQDAELYWAVRKLDLMIRIFLLVKIGIPADTIYKAVKNPTKPFDQSRVWKHYSERGTGKGD